MTELDYIIVGQGVAGTILSHKLIKKGRKVIVIDNDHKKSSSTKAAGIINPITGRSYVKSWKIDELIPAAIDTYSSLKALLGSTYYYQHIIVRVLNSIAEENKWSGRLLEDAYQAYIVRDYDLTEVKLNFHNVGECAVIKGGRVDLNTLLTDYKNWLQNNQLLISEEFDYRHLLSNDRGITYKEYKANHIIFAEGVSSVDNPVFTDLPFQPVKGEVLLVRIEDYELNEIVKHGFFVCPFGNDGLYWVGSGYERGYEDGNPTETGRIRLVEQLESILNCDYEIIQHMAGIRPSVKGRKPLIGRSPSIDNAWIFGGLGTKGSSLAPYWADHLIEVIENDVVLDPEVDINRF